MTLAVYFMCLCVLDMCLGSDVLCLFCFRVCVTFSCTFSCASSMSAISSGPDLSWPNQGGSFHVFIH